MLTWPPKYPDEVLDYVDDWTARLAGDTIASGTISVTAGSVVIQSQVCSPTTIVAWFVGGMAGEVCEFRSEIVSTGGRTFEDVANIKILSPL